MTVKGIESVTLKTKEFKPLDLKQITQSSKNVKVCKEKISANLKYQTVYTPKTDMSINRIFKVWDKFYINYADGRVCECGDDGENIIAFTMSTGDYVLTPVICNGSKGVLITERGTASEVHVGIFASFIELPVDEYSLMLGNLFFVAGGNFLSYTDAVDFSEFKGEITFPLDAGKIVGMTAVDKKIVVVCEFAVYLVTAFGESTEFTVERVLDNKTVALKDTVKKVKDNVVFTDGKNLFAYKDRAVKEIAIAGTLSGYRIIGSACADGNCYVLSLLKDGVRYLYRHDFNDDSDAFIKVDSPAVCDGYAVIDGNICALFDVGEGNSLQVGEWKSIPMDLNSSCKKTLLSVSASVKGNADITVGEKTGKKTFRLSETGMIKRPNYTAERFRLSLVGENFTAENLKLKYTETGVN